MCDPKRGIVCYASTILGVVLLLDLVGCGPARRTGTRPTTTIPAMQKQPGIDTERLRPVLLTRPLRVALRLGPEDVTVVATHMRDAQAESTTIGPPLVILQDSGQDPLGRFSRLILRPAGDGVTVIPSGDASRTFPDTLRIRAPADAALQVNDTVYRGSIEVYCQASGELTIVNVVDLEDYLRGVVPLEIGYPSRDAYAAVRAQAVAARTYVLSHLRRWPAEGFDVYGDARDQAYGGRTAENAGISDAVTETAGIVATYDGLMIGAFYSACCGGRSAPAHETWEFPPMPYLQFRKDRKGGADFCADYRHFRWQERWTAEEFTDLLRAHYVEEFGGERPPAGPLEDLSIDARFESGRVRKMTIRAGGRRYAMGGDRLRWVMRRGGVGGAILRSSHFDLTLEGRRGRVVAVVAHGAGNGHGVGMCQVGALEMARQGYDFEEILQHYYPGIKLARLWQS